MDNAIHERPRCVYCPVRKKLIHKEQWEAERSKLHLLDLHLEADEVREQISAAVSSRKD